MTGIMNLQATAGCSTLGNLGVKTGGFGDKIRKLHWVIVENKKISNSSTYRLSDYDNWKAPLIARSAGC